jgi:hypothetical protein
MKSEEQIRIKLESLKNYKKYIDENADTMTATSWVRQSENASDSIQLLAWILDMIPSPCHMDEEVPWQYNIVE